MTLYFPTSSENSLTATIFLDGDLSGATELNPDGYSVMALQLISKYTNSNIVQPADSYDWLFKVTILESNERWTKLSTDASETASTINEFKSGYYDFKLWGTYLPYGGADGVTTTTGGAFDEDQWDLVLEGETKIKTDTTNDMQRGHEPETVKYTTDPNTAQSYVIYKD